MAPISASIAIDTPREDAFEFLADLANRPAICDHFLREFRLERIESAGVGAAARFRLGERGPWAETVIEEVVAPHRIVERGRAGRLGRIPTVTVWELVEGAHRSGCEVTVTLWWSPAHPADRVREALSMGRRERRRWRTALARLKHELENPGPVERVGVAGGDRIPVA